MSAALFTILVRRFSVSTNANSKLISPAIRIYSVEGRYAHALYSAAAKEKKIDIVEKELKDFQALLLKEPKLSSYVSNPAVKRSEKREVLKNVMTKLNYSNLTANYFDALADNSRFGKVNAFLQAFTKLMSSHKGEVVCTVTTAKELDAVLLKELKVALEAFLQKGEILFLETKVDPHIIGGMVVTIGDKYVDMSMLSKIKTYTNIIKQAV